MRTLLRYLKPQSRELSSAIALGSFALTSSIGLLAASGWLISMASTRPPILVLEVAIVSVRFFGLARGVFRYFGRILEHNSALKIQTELRISTFKKLDSLVPSTFSDFRRGSLMQQIVNDVEVVQDLWLRLGIPWITSVIAGVAGIGIISWLLPTLALVVATIFLLTAFLAPLLTALSQGNAHQHQHEGELFEQIMQSCESVNESLIFNYQYELFEEIDVQQDSITVIENRTAKWAGLGSALYSKVLGATVVISALMASSAYARGEIAGVNVAVLILLPLAIFDGISSLPVAFSKSARVIDSIRQIEPILAIAELPNEKKIFLREEQLNLEINGAQPIVGSMQLPEFNGFASPGHPLIVMGKSGIGKSSLINAILGFVEYRGDILVNGHMARHLDTNIYSVLLQDDYLFNTSIRENLKIGKPTATDREIEQMLEVVELSDLVRSLPEGLNTTIGSFGYNFSGGEKQRLKLARVLLRNTPIFLLDEPFEFLEAHQADRIAKKVMKVLATKTVVIVSHLPLPCAI